MPPDQKQNINLLPGDLQRKREVIKKVIANDQVEYTQPKKNKAELLPKQPFKKSGGLLDFLKRKHTSAKRPESLGSGLKVSSQKYEVPKKPDLKMPSAPVPKADFLHQLHKIPTPAKPVEPPVVKVEKVQKEKKESWWSRFFAKKPSLAPITPAPKIIPTFPTSTSTSTPLPPLPPPPPILSTPKAPAVNKVPAERPVPELDVNLLSKEYAEVFKAKNQKTIFITSLVITVFAVLFAYLVIHLYQLQQGAKAREASQMNTELEKTMATYGSLEQEDAMLLQRVTILKGLLANHISFNKFLGLLESATTPEVTYTIIAISQEGMVSMSALATDYTALGRQLSILQTNTPWIKEAKVTSAQLARDSQAKVGGVKFDLVLKVDPSVFKETSSP